MSSIFETLGVQLDESKSVRAGATTGRNRSKVGQDIGRKSGLTVQQLVCRLLTDNLNTGLHLTEAQFTAILRSEFDLLHKGAGPKQSPSVYISYFNTGRHGYTRTDLTKEMYDVIKDATGASRKVLKPQYRHPTNLAS